MNEQARSLCRGGQTDPYFHAVYAGLRYWKRKTPPGGRVLYNRDDIRAIFTNVNMPGSIDGIRRSLIVGIASGRLKPGAGDLTENVTLIAEPYNDRPI